MSEEFEPGEVFLQIALGLAVRQRVLMSVGYVCQAVGCRCEGVLLE